ncbi:MAG: hypothetical protein U0232_16145 [Thermomicrobiales bacterium]
MHSSKELTSETFAFRVAGQPVSFADVFPGFEQRDRIGIVSRSAGGALGASAGAGGDHGVLHWAPPGRRFFRYPDYFLFHVGASVGKYGMLDIWPEHKEVAVPEGDPEALLRAINDRAITHLLVEDGAAGTAEFGRATLGSVGLRHALAFAADGRVRDADLEVTGNAVTERYVAAVIDALAPLADDERAAIRERRAALLDDGVPTETFRRLKLDEALALLAAPAH